MGSAPRQPCPQTNRIPCKLVIIAEFCIFGGVPHNLYNLGYCIGHVSDPFGLPSDCMQRIGKDGELAFVKSLLQGLLPAFINTVPIAILQASERD